MEGTTFSVQTRGKSIVPFMLSRTRLSEVYIYTYTHTYTISLSILYIHVYRNVRIQIIRVSMFSPIV